MSVLVPSQDQLMQRSVKVEKAVRTIGLVPGFGIPSMENGGHLLSLSLTKYTLPRGGASVDERIPY